MPLVRKDAAKPPQPASVDAASALASASVQERWQAARLLGTDPGAEAKLAEALGRETDLRVREAIFTSLACLGTAASIDVVLPHLRSPDANLRSGALDALRAMVGAVRPRLAALLSDPDPDVRLQICDLVRELPSEEATTLLRAVIERETLPNICGAAVDVLADIGDASALPSLKRCAARFIGEPFLTFAIAIAAERIVSQRPPAS
jgi:HEAT repeat protein